MANLMATASCIPGPPVSTAMIWCISCGQCCICCVAEGQSNFLTMHHIPLPLKCLCKCNIVRKTFPCGSLAVMDVIFGLMFHAKMTHALTMWELESRFVVSWILETLDPRILTAYCKWTDGSLYSHSHLLYIFVFFLHGYQFNNFDCELHSRLYTCYAWCDDGFLGCTVEGGRQREKGMFADDFGASQLYQTQRRRKLVQFGSGLVLTVKCVQHLEC